jgi:hypothetical protein
MLILRLAARAHFPAFSRDGAIDDTPSYHEALQLVYGATTSGQRAIRIPRILLVRVKTLPAKHDHTNLWVGELSMTILSDFFLTNVTFIGGSDQIVFDRFLWRL